MNTNNKILVIDDEAEMLHSSSKVLKMSGYTTYPLQDSTQIEKVLQTETFDLILCDLLMPKMDGYQVLTFVKKMHPETPVIIFTAYGTIDRAVECMKAGAFDFIEKPYEAEHLKVVVERALQYSNLYQERINLIKQLEEKYKFDNIIGKSKAIRSIFEVIKSAAQSDANVFITGESGTGKELIARSIHARSKSQTKPFVPINCGAFPETLFESEIFGHEKGSFTGASEKKIGLLEFANTGTFFLDEVCELPLNLQTKLLRVIQDKKLRRIGGHDLISVDVRFISATNKEPMELLSQKKLREDFYYRLNVINIHIPPLRERIEDVRVLAEYFLPIYAEKAGKNITGFSADVIDALQKYKWPGNVRELENVIERAVAFTDGNEIKLSNLPGQFNSKEKVLYFFNDSSLKQVRQQAIEESEKQYLHFLLNKHNGNITKVADESGVTTRNVYRLISQYHIDLSLWRSE